MNGIMAGGQDAINRYLITGMMDLRENGCAKGCASAVDRWTPATLLTALMGAVYTFHEWAKRP